ncbi:MAG: hypothetical protein KJO69_01105, partial [Gammaproteobacteria bacterium]|nr:hypothetical protein [Gammaproteobacteria bacterium]
MYDSTMLRFSSYLIGLYILGTLLTLPLAPVNAKETQALPLQEIQELAQVLELIKKNHVTTKSDRELLLAAINGMLASLDNQSRYLTSEELALFTRVATGNQRGKATTHGKMINNNILYIDIDYFHASTAQVVE